MAANPALENLTERQQQAIIALLSKGTIAGAARSAGVGERTLHTWLGDPTFIEAYRAARRESVRAATAALQRASADAVTTIASIMRDKTAPPAVRLSAARSVLELALQGLELDDVLARLAAVEAKRL